MRAGKKRTLVTVSKRTDEQGSRGQQKKTLEKIFDAKVSVKTVSGVELIKAGAALTKEVKSILMSYDARLKHDHFITQNGDDYDVVSIKPDDRHIDMTVTITRDI